MKFDDLLKAGRAMSEQERVDTLTSLCSDPRFAAWVGLMDETRTQFVQVLGDQAMAQSHGNLAHCAGSIHALMHLEGVLRVIADKPEP